MAPLFLYFPLASFPFSFKSWEPSYTCIYPVCTLHFNLLVRITEGTCSHVLRSTSVDSQRFVSIMLKCSVLKCIVIVILWVYYMVISLGFILFWHFLTSLLNFLSYFVWLRITDEGSVPEMRILSKSHLIEMVYTSFWDHYIKILRVEMYCNCNFVG